NPNRSADRVYEALALRAEARRRSNIDDEVRFVCPERIDTPDAGHALVGRPLKQDLIVARRPRRGRGGTLAPSDLDRPAAGEIDDPDLLDARCVADEGHHRAVRR